MSSGFPLFFDACHELREFAKMLQLFALVLVVCAAGRRQDVNTRTIKQLFLDTIDAARAVHTEDDVAVVAGAL